MHAKRFRLFLWIYVCGGRFLKIALTLSKCKGKRVNVFSEDVWRCKWGLRCSDKRVSNITFLCETAILKVCLLSFISLVQLSVFFIWYFGNFIDKDHYLDSFETQMWSPKWDLMIKLGIVVFFKAPGLSSKHIQYGPVDPITHPLRSLIWGSDTDTMWSVFRNAQGLWAALREEEGVRERERKMGVVFCPNRPSWTDKPIASACFVNRGDSNGRTERQTFSRTRWGQRWMVGRSLASSGQRILLLISDPHWPIDWLWGISHQLNLGHIFLLQPWATGRALSAIMRKPLYGDGWTFKQARCLWQNCSSVS